MTARLAVAHLVRAANGPAVFADFVGSYRAHAPGCAHDLLLICKGFADSGLPADFASVVGDLAHHAFFVSDAGVDVSVYFAAARAHEYHRLCFVNSFSVVQDAGWLRKLDAHAARDGIGVVGATGSWESPATAVLPAVAPAWRPLTPRRVAGSLWRRGTAAARFARARLHYPVFPNPHLRTNAFVVRRDILLGLRVGDVDTKEGAERFESGSHGLTRQLRDRGLAALVVGRDGRAFGPEQWPTSGTFRSGEQANLLVSDNRTRQYAEGDVATRRRLASLAWGNAA